MNSEFIIAVHIAVFLRHKQDWRTSEEIAENACTNAVCVRRVAGKLVRKGLIEKRVGRTNGGYKYSREISLADISNALDLKAVECSYRSGDVKKMCMIASGMSSFVDELLSHLEIICQKHLEKISIADVEKYLEKLHYRGEDNENI